MIVIQGKLMKQKITIYDIAKTAGVSPATVSRMIHQPGIVTEKTREKIIEAFNYHKIHPEDLSLKKKSIQKLSGKSTCITLSVLVCIPSWDNPFYDNILQGIQEVFNQANCHAIVLSEMLQQSSIHSFLNYCKSLQISGIIMMYPLTDDLLRQLNAIYPIVQCSEYNPFYAKTPYVSIDDYSISKEAVAHLLKKGSRKIAFFSASFEYHHVQNRYRAYKTMLSSNGIELRPEYIVQVSDFSYDRIFHAACRFFELTDPPDAIFATSDQHAHAAVKAADTFHFHIPEDIRIFGFDNTMFSQLSVPTISTVAQPRRELGVESARLMLKLIYQENENLSSILLPAKIIIREST